MSVRAVRVIGGPLDGGTYDLDGDPEERIDLNSAAGVCVYEFATSDADEHVVNYIGPAPSARSASERSKR